MISKPSHLNVLPWQLVSAELGGVSLRSATWARPRIPTTTSSTSIGCWDPSLRTPGAVEIAVSGQWEDKQFGLKGGPGPDFNHAKIGVSISGLHNYSIFGDMNQQGSLSGPNCGSSQNGRGGLFYVIDNQTLSGSIMTLLNGDTAAEGVAHKNSKVSPIKDLKSALLQTFDRGCQINDHQIRLYIGYAFRSRQQRVDEFVWKLRLRRSHSTKRCPQ
jgi:hypothetical protein